MYYFIVNPNAKSGKGRIIWQKVCRVMNSKGLTYEALFTEKKGQAAELAREAAERSRRTAQGERTNQGSDEKIIVAMGGDGTISEVLDGIWDHPEVTFAFIPIGSGNDWYIVRLAQSPGRYSFRKAPDLFPSGASGI